MSSSARETELKAASPASRVTPSPARTVLPSPQAARVAAISAEIPLEIHGSRKSKSDGHPIEAFHEETVTVILFPQGGIVRLAAEVTRGQMMAVTNLNTQRGMLCRVVNVRAYPSLKSYVELEFTQPAAGFWGVNFPEEAAPCEVSPVPEPPSAPETKPAEQSDSEIKPEQGSAPPAAAIQTESQQPTRGTNSGEAVALEATVVHVSSDEPSAAPQSAAPKKPREAKTEDFWGKSFPAELIESALTLAAEAASSVAPSPESSEAPASASTETQPVSNLEADPIELAIEDDEAWQKLLAQVPKKVEEPEPTAKPEISEENLQLESVAPKVEAPALTPDPPRAAESPRASVRPEGFLSNSAAIPPAPQPEPSATLKELERLALEHLDSSQEQQRVPAPAKIQEPVEKPKRSTPPGT